MKFRLQVWIEINPLPVYLALYREVMRKCNFSKRIFLSLKYSIKTIACWLQEAIGYFKISSAMTIAERSYQINLPAAAAANFPGDYSDYNCDKTESG